MKNYLITLLIMTTCWQAQLYAMFRGSYDRAMYTETPIGRAHNILGLVFTQPPVYDPSVMEYERRSNYALEAFEKRSADLLIQRQQQQQKIVIMHTLPDEYHSTSTQRLIFDLGGVPEREMQKVREQAKRLGQNLDGKEELQRLHRQSLAAQKQMRTDRKQAVKAQQQRYKNQPPNNYAVKNKRR